MKNYVPPAAKTLFEKRVPDSQKLLINKQKFYGGPGGGFSKEPPGRRRQKTQKDDKHKRYRSNCD
jgi:hypothetical protein